jgi:dihydrofolate reductase
MISLIVAIADNRAIGKNNDLLWHLPDDLKHFKRTTSGHPIIMGRKTFESFGARPLPKRTNVVITRGNAYTSAGNLVVVRSLDEALEQVKEDDEIFIIGGGEIYKQAMPLIDRMYLTVVHHQFEADTYFPAFDESQWTEVANEYHPADEKHAYAFTIKTLERKQ